MQQCDVTDSTTVTPSSHEPPKHRSYDAAHAFGAAAPRQGEGY
jgi:hypothetical protein